jgi:hypothetical protein
MVQYVRWYGCTGVLKKRDDGKLLIVFVIAAVLVAAIIALVLWLIPQL